LVSLLLADSAKGSWWGVDERAMKTPACAPSCPKKLLTLAVASVATAALLLPAGAVATPKPAVLTLKTVRVGAAGNPSAAIVPFTDAIYRSCAEAPQTGPACQEVGAVKHSFGIGQLEVTVGQWVAFLNTVDPLGRNRHGLYSSTESGAAWPRFGQIDFAANAPAARHYTVAAPEWADKPFGFANFLRAARFVNSLYNGRVLSRQGSAAGFHYVTYRVRLSRRTERGMYDMANPKTTRLHKAGFVLPSQDEWIKAAYYDPSGGGTDSYWKYPTNSGVFGDGTATAPAVTALDPATGNVTNAAVQPLANYHASGQPVPSWCPSNQSAEACASGNPFGLDPTLYQEAFQGSLSSVGQALTPSPWGTLDQGGNAVEWTDTITPPPFGVKGVRVWRRLHGGIANAPAYQLWLSAVGLQPQDNTFYTATYPWLGFRVGVVGKAG
jgi:formylglycine-generating enzyme required for sulfatase activity